MNVQDVIEKALAGNDGIPVTPVEHSSCEDVQVEKLASALNFIGANLESSVHELEKLAKDHDKSNAQSKREKIIAGTALTGGVGATLGGGFAARSYHKGLKSLPEARQKIVDAEKLMGPNPMFDRARKTVADAEPLLKSKRNKNLGIAGIGALTAAYGAKKLYDARKRKQQKKTASADDALYHAAQAGKQALLEKVAEDRINPAQISAGPADPYSGEIMPNPGKVSNEFIGNTRDHHALIALKAQKVRDRINKDMKQYVNNVGDGYNLQGHLNKMNK